MVDTINLMKSFALKNLLTPVEMPSPTLAVDHDEQHNDIPILIFREQYQQPANPTVQRAYELSYEQVQQNGTGAALSIEDFSTDSFDIGAPYGRV